MGNQMGALMKSALIPALFVALGLAACAQSAQTTPASMAQQNQVSSDATQAARLPQSAAGAQMLQVAIAAGAGQHRGQRARCPLDRIDALRPHREERRKASRNC